jgi:hypothetical protein
MILSALATKPVEVKNNSLLPALNYQIGKMPESQAEKNRGGLECYVLDEYVVPQDRADTMEAGHRSGGQSEAGHKSGKQAEAGDKKRGQNKHRPIFKENPKVGFSIH